MIKQAATIILSMAFTMCKGQTNNGENQLASLYKQVRFRDRAVEYRTNIEVGACNFELLINDVPVEQYFGDAEGTVNTSVPINDAILQTGAQHWKLIVYPGERKGKQLEELSPNVLIDIEIEKITKGGSQQEAGAVKKLVTTSLVKRDGREVFADAGKRIVVYEGSFPASVPYNIPGWTKGQDLQKEDSLALQREVLAYYQKYAGFYNEKNVEGIYSAVLAKERERAQYFFLDAEGCKETIKDYKEFLSFPSPNVLPVEHYRMRFYGNGKIVALERTDPPNKGEPVTRIEYKDKNGKTVTEFMYCYLMRNASGQLEMIR
ncbi:hypothetical protein [Taibaiella koreensis]|uniref:hypothetical protein n=1 Tax=Taibaiella koreensis TaxID=1268548 RepID=UPI0019692CE3|nr:hypothetical protein [Taibaiella koreensis]